MTDEKPTGFINDENGKKSTTRLTVLVTLFVFTVAAVTDIFTDVVIDGQVYNIIQTVFGVGLGGQAVRTSISNYRGK